MFFISIFDAKSHQLLAQIEADAIYVPSIPVCGMLSSNHIWQGSEQEVCLQGVWLAAVHQIFPC